MTSFRQPVAERAACGPNSTVEAEGIGNHPADARVTLRGFPSSYSGFLSAGCRYHSRVPNTPDPMSRWEVLKFIFLGVFISAVLTGLIVLAAIRASNP
jgi:hypothetical protein